MEQLLVAGADARVVDAEGCTPLHGVLDVACVDMLLDAGTDLEARDTEDMTAICVAACDLLGIPEAVLRLADRGVDLFDTGGEPGLVERRVERLRALRASGQREPDVFDRMVALLDDESNSSEGD